MGKVISLAVLALIVGVVTLGGWALVTAPPAFAGGVDKVPVCHITAVHDFGFGGDVPNVPIGHEINIADPALPKHVEHGDVETFVETSLPDGKTVCVADLDDNDVADYKELCYTNEQQSFKLSAGLGDLVRDPDNNNFATGNTDRFSTTDCSGGPDTLLVGVSFTFRLGDGGADTDTDLNNCNSALTELTGVTFTGPTLHHKDPEADPGHPSPTEGVIEEFWTVLGYANAPGDWWVCANEAESFLRV